MVATSILYLLYFYYFYICVKIIIDLLKVFAALTSITKMGKNFKIRINAAMALAVISAREHYGDYFCDVSLYIFINNINIKLIVQDSTSCG